MLVVDVAITLDGFCGGAAGVFMIVSSLTNSSFSPFTKATLNLYCLPDKQLNACK